MDVYGESGRRAHRTGVVGVDAETEDTVDNLEVYEALVNPKEAGSGGNKGRGGMMPPMMMGGVGAGGGSSAAASAGASQAAAASTAGATARAVPGPMAAGTTTAAPVASPGVGAGTAGAATTPSFGGAGLPSGGGGGIPTAGLGAGVVAAQSDDAAAADADPGAGTDAPQTDPDPATDDESGDGGPVDGIGRINPVPPNNTDLPENDVVEVNPAEIERLAKQWSSLSDSMTGLSTNISNLQADAGAFGMVRDPEPVYGKMTDGLSRRSGGAAAEFEQISAGLAASAAAFRDTEDDATASLGGLSQ
ncbi:hypothetical protein FOJ82_14085 [Tessaracoccus rhinocerotis]|uniref:Uncharacterized protein n=1 Tax=Tessaracoccus rhinocerotis TaxID=1689449 RepID=A0A553JX16_9ACTN|nr:hypothetical protein [Tessaracoccus rhinocerotis]TRY16984.1 hypothetical protein FOJ82_14085 [Tessaracoccus rhinocerotis]